MCDAGIMEGIRNASGFGNTGLSRASAQHKVQ